MSINSTNDKIDANSNFKGKINRNKGFTVVELVVVIVIIGIISATLIPFFLDIMKKAEQRATKDLVDNLNLCLTVERTDENKKLSVDDAVKIISNSGIASSSLVGDIVYSESGSCFEIAESGNSQDKTTTWKFYENIIEIDKNYSVYLLGNESVSEINLDGISFNAGENSNIEKVIYTNSLSENSGVSLTTNSGNIYIDAENDEVTHYGTANEIEITAVAENSYYENGNVGKISIEKGHLVLGETANVENIKLITAQNEQEISTTKDIKISLKNESNVPKFIVEDEITIDETDLTLAIICLNNNSLEYEIGFDTNGTTFIKTNGENVNMPNEILTQIKNDLSNTTIKSKISEDKNTIYINTADDWDNIFANSEKERIENLKIILQSDFNFSNAKKYKRIITAILNIEIDGNGKTITGAKYPIFGINATFSGNIVIRNLTIKSAILKEKSAFVQNSFSASDVSMQFENITILDSTISSCPAFISSITSSGNIVVSLNNCKIINCKIEYTNYTAFLKDLSDGKLTLTACKIDEIEINYNNQ